MNRGRGNRGGSVARGTPSGARGRGRGRGGARGRGEARGGRGGRGDRGGRGGGRGGALTEAERPEPQMPLDINVPFRLLTPLELKDLKETLLNVVASALIQQPKMSVTDPTIQRITRLVKGIAFYDPEFILKLAVYVRLDLNIRSTANYLLALASNLTDCQPYVRKYLPHAVRLPSDWLDVAATYQLLPDKQLGGKSLPTALRKAMVDKFPDFDPYQLGKYNKERAIKRKLKEKKEAPLEAAPANKANEKPMLTLKQMIRQLHIATPVINVMSLLGKKYPENEREFAILSIPGKFDAEKAGKRMKLPTPETWETLLSEKGNKSSTWEELIEHKKLPFMAMLRNLRNLIFSGVHPKYHRWVQNKLSNEQTVASSRQFPFQFFSAYEIIPENLEAFKKMLEEANAPPKEKKKADGTADETQVRRKRKNPIIPTNMPTDKIFDDYRKALDQSVKLATVHNVQPIRGSTVVFCNVSSETKANAPGAKGMGKSVRNIQEIGYLLGLMCKYVCEDCDFRVWASTSPQHPDTNHLPVALKEGTILDNMKVVAEIAAQLGEAPGPFPIDYLTDMIRDKKRVDNLLVLSHQPLNPSKPGGDDSVNKLANLLAKYRGEVNPDLLFVSVDLSGSRAAISGDEKHPNDIMIAGFSDQILRFIAERGDQNQLQYVEHIATAKGINKKSEKQHEPVVEVSPWWKWLDSIGTEKEETHYPNITSGSEWKEARVFISSTFLDMHGERDILTRIVFPELKERCKQRKVNLYEVDLRWGITEEEGLYGKQIQLCLDEVDRCKPFFIGMLGERYGWAPDTYEVPDHPRFEWLKQFPAKRSITELEMHHAALADPSNARGTFFYLRDSTVMSDIPEQYQKYFSARDDEDVSKMAELKNRIRSSGLPVFENYPAKFGGVDDEGRPITADLKLFAAKVFDDLWGAISEAFPEPEENHDPILSERQCHQNFVFEATQNFYGRQELLKDIDRFFITNRHKFMAVTAKPGEGKSSLLANFAQIYAEKNPKTFVLSHFIGASPASVDIRNTLERLCRELKLAFALEDPVPTEYKELVNCFRSFLEQATFKGKVIVIIDALDQLDHTIHRAHALEWLPALDNLPCKFLVSTLETGMCADVIQRRMVAFPAAITEMKIPALNVDERKHLIRSILARYHKKLDEKPMNNQMRVLIKKGECSSPLYITVACEELRVFGVYERIADRIKSMGDKLPKLFDEVLARLEVDHTKQLIQKACSYLFCSRGGLYERELVALLGIPRYVWGGILRSLASFLKINGDTGLMNFFHGQFAAAVQKRYVGTARLLSQAHADLARFYHNSADPAKDGSWSGGNDVRAVQQLPYHLVKADMFVDLVGVLTDLTFIELKFAHGLGQDLIADYNTATADGVRFDKIQQIRDLKTFVKANAHVLSDNPALTFQQAANQPDNTHTAKVAQEQLKAGKATKTWLEWTNKPQASDANKMTFSGYTEGLTATAFSPDGNVLACASRDCLIRLYDSATGTELITLAGHSQWVVALAFSPNGSTIASASWDGSMKLWDVSSGNQLASCEGHDRRVNAVAFSLDGSMVASASWDCTIMVWSPQANGKETRPKYTIRVGDRPVNSIAFLPDGKRIVAGTWEGLIKIFAIEEGTLQSTMVGHDKSVSSVAAAPSGKHIVSGSLDRRLVLWDGQAGKMIATLSRHAKPVTSVAYTHDGSHLLSASEDATVKVWRAHLGQEKRGLKVESGHMNCVAFSPITDARLATGSSECYLVVWDLALGKEVFRAEGHTRPISAVEYSPDGSEIATASEDGLVIIWDAETGARKLTYKGHSGPVNSISYGRAAGDRRIASGGDDFKVYLWDSRTGEQLLPPFIGHTSTVRHVAFDSKGKLLVSASRDGTVRVWDSRNGNELQVFRGHKDWLNGCHINESGSRVVSCSWDYTLKLWNRNKGGESGTMEGHNASVSYVRFSPDNKTVVSSSFDGTIKIWDADTATEITTLTGHESRVNSFCFNAAGNAIASVCDDGTIKIWDPLAATEVRTLVGHASPIRSANFSPAADKYIVSASDDKSMRLWDVGIGEAKPEPGSGSFSSFSSSFSFGSKEEEKKVDVNSAFFLTGHSAMINDVDLSANANLLLVASDDCTASLWDLPTQSKLRLFKRREASEMAFNACAFSPDGNLAVTACADGAVVLWDIRERKKLRNVAQHKAPASAVAFSGDGIQVISGGWDNAVYLSDQRYSSANKLCSGHTDWVTGVSIDHSRAIAVSSSWDGRVGVWNAGNARSTRFLEGHTATVTSCALSPDARLVASTSYDASVKIWNVDSGKLERTLMRHRGRVNKVAFSQEANLMLTAGHDHTVKLWDTKGWSVKNEFVCQGPATALAVRKNAQSGKLVMLLGDSIGNLYYVALRS